MKPKIGNTVTISKNNSYLSHREGEVIGEIIKVEKSIAIIKLTSGELDRIVYKWEDGSVNNFYDWE